MHDPVNNLINETLRITYQFNDKNIQDFHDQILKQGKFNLIILIDGFN